MGMLGAPLNVGRTAEKAVLQLCSTGGPLCEIRLLSPLSLSTTDRPTKERPAGGQAGEAGGAGGGAGGWQAAKAATAHGTRL